MYLMRGLRLLCLMRGIRLLYLMRGLRLLCLPFVLQTDTKKNSAWDTLPALFFL